MIIRTRPKVHTIVAPVGRSRRSDKYTPSAETTVPIVQPMARRRPMVSAYSMAATLGLIVALVGVHSPGTLIVSFLPMLCIAYAFRELNKADPDCGTTFTWTARAFGPRTGWMGGWGLIAADIIVMASLAQIAGRYFMQLVGLQGAGTVWVTVAGITFIAGGHWATETFGVRRLGDLLSERFGVEHRFIAVPNPV